MPNDLSKRLARIEAQTAPPRQTHFLTLEGPPGLPEGKATAFLRASGHRWGENDIVFVTTYESRDPDAPLRDLTGKAARLRPQAH